MVSFVESATLKLNSQAAAKAVTDIRKINTALRSLNNTAQSLKKTLNGLDLDAVLRSSARSTGLTRAATEVRALNKELSKLRAAAGRPFNINVNQTAKVPPAATRPVAPVVARPAGLHPMVSATPAPVAVVPPTGGRRPSPASTFNPAVAGGRAPRASVGAGVGGSMAGIRVGGLTVKDAIIYAGAFTVGRAAVNAGLEAQRTAASINATVQDPAIRAAIQTAATDAVDATNRISSTRAAQIALDSYRSGARGTELSNITSTLAQLESRASIVSPGLDATGLTLLANRVLNLGNALGDAERQAELLTGTFGAAVVAGESFNQATFLAALRTSGFATTISQEGLVGLGLLVDAQGQRAGSGLNRLRKELTTPLAQAGAGAGIAKGAVESLIAGGLRGTEGITKEQQSQFERDPLEFIQKVIAPLVQAKGVNLEERSEIRRFLARSGFNETSQRVLLDALTSVTETQRARETAAGFNVREQDLTSNLPAALANLRAGFESFSASVLTPLFERVAPLVTSFGDSLFTAAKWVNTLTEAQIDLAVQVGAVTGGLAVLVGAFKGVQGIVGFLRAGPALTRSATQLSAAAAALQRAAVVGGAAGAGQGKGAAGRGAWGRGALGSVRGAVGGVVGGIAGGVALTTGTNIIVNEMQVQAPNLSNLQAGAAGVAAGLVSAGAAAPFAASATLGGGARTVSAGGTNIAPVSNADAEAGALTNFLRRLTGNTDADVADKIAVRTGEEVRKAMQFGPQQLQPFGPSLTPAVAAGAAGPALPSAAQLQQGKLANSVITDASRLVSLMPQAEDEIAKQLEVSLQSFRGPDIVSGLDELGSTLNQNVIREETNAREGHRLMQAGNASVDAQTGLMESMVGLLTSIATNIGILQNQPGARYGLPAPQGDTGFSGSGDAGATGGLGFGFGNAGYS